MTYKTTEKNQFKDLEIHQDRKPVRYFPAVQIAVVVFFIAMALTAVKACNQGTETISLTELNRR